MRAQTWNLGKWQCYGCDYRLLFLIALENIPFCFVLIPFCVPMLHLFTATLVRFGLLQEAVSFKLKLLL